MRRSKGIRRGLAARAGGETDALDEPLHVAPEVAVERGTRQVGIGRRVGCDVKLVDEERDREDGETDEEVGPGEEGQEEHDPAIRR